MLELVAPLTGAVVGALCAQGPVWLRERGKDAAAAEREAAQLAAMLRVVEHTLSRLLQTTEPEAVRLDPVDRVLQFAYGDGIATLLKHRKLALEFYSSLYMFDTNLQYADAWKLERKRQARALSEISRDPKSDPADIEEQEGFVSEAGAQFMRGVIAAVRESMNIRHLIGAQGVEADRNEFETLTRNLEVPEMETRWPYYD